MEVSKTDADGQVIGTSYWERVDIGFNDFFRLIQEYAELKDMKKILFILGSLRAKSFNRQVANVAKEIIGERAEVLKEQVGIAVPAEAWGTDVLVLTDEQKAALKALADRLIEG